MVELWFALLGFTLIMFAVLDGWNFGAGVLHFVVARNAAERREVIAAIGPAWSWHEVWLIAAGGTFLLAFPAVMAAAFAGFYLALWMVLWSFVLRGIAIEVGGHLDDELWRAGWDFIFAAASVLLAVLFGAALGNVIRGVPLGPSGRFSMSLFTHFGVRGQVGILDWYTLSTALFTTLLVAAHGAVYLAMTAHGVVRARAAVWARRLWAAAVVGLVIVSIETWVVRPALAQQAVSRPLAWIAIAAMAVGGWTLARGLGSGVYHRAFAGSCGVIAGLLAGAAAAMFPVMLHSTLGEQYSIDAYRAATAASGLSIALVWWPIALVLALVYLVVIVRPLTGTAARSH